MFILNVFRKTNETKTIAVSEDEIKLREIAKLLNKHANFRSGESIWDREDIKGFAFIQEVNNNPTLAYELGVNFLNHLDWKQ